MPKILFVGICFLITLHYTRAKARSISVPFLGKSYIMEIDDRFSVPFGTLLSDSAIVNFESRIQKSDYQPLISHLLDIRKEQKLNDWLFYQLIRN